MFTAVATSEARISLILRRADDLTGRVSPVPAQPGARPAVRFRHDRIREAVLGIGSLRELGIAVADRGSTDLDQQFGLLYQWLDDTAAADDLSRPDITEPKLLATSGLIDAVLPPVCFTADHATLAWLSPRLRRVTIFAPSGQPSGRCEPPQGRIATPAWSTALGNAKASARPVTSAGWWAAGLLGLCRIVGGIAVGECREVLMDRADDR